MDLPVEQEKTKPVTIDKLKVFYAAICVVIILLSLNLYFTVTRDKTSNLTNTAFNLLDPSISHMDVNDFLETRASYTASYKPLKTEVEQILSQANGKFGVYFEDLTFGSWFGINERELFTPASLLKVTTAAAIFKQAEEGETLLDTKVTLTADDLNFKYGDLYKKEGETYTIEELIKIALIYSDNTAIKKLHQYMLPERWAEARLVMGLPVASIDEATAGISLTPKEFSSVFRSLYYSGYLRRTFSNEILTLLSETDFTDGIPSGVPEDIVVSHKIGEWIEAGSVHDCGIVYAEKPYILCIMSQNTSAEEGTRVIREISKTVYDYISKS